MPSITVGDLERAFGEQLSPALAEKVRRADLRYEQLSLPERDEYIRTVVDELTGDAAKVAGEHRHPDWESGWGENLTQFIKTRDLDALIPRYHRKRQIVHWGGDVVKAVSPDFDLRIHELLVEHVFERYLARVPAAMEFGCGPAYHLLRLRQLNPTAKLVGLDWARASSEIIAKLRELQIETNIEGHVFNFFSPDYSVPVPSGAGVYTIAALEQVGSRHEPFIQFLLAKRPAVCVHLEPISELLERERLVDRLSQLYFRRRNYLDGFLTRLRALRDEGRITIHREQRTYTGSYFIEGHSLIVWSPNV